MTPENRFDLVIVGAGVVGMSFALAMRPAGARIALLESRMPEPGAAPEAFDNRVYAISPSNVTFLSALGAWPRLAANRIAPVHRMEIFGDDDTRLDFDASEAGVRELAAIVENARLTDALLQAVREQSAITIFNPAQCATLSLGEDHADLTLADGAQLRAGLIVGADGADSWVREQSGITTQEKDYLQIGVVANFSCEKPHRATARQWFRADGVLAWLPLPGERISIVWSTGSDHARALLALSSAEFAQTVQEAGGERLGKLDLLSAVAGFPLRLTRVRQLVKLRLALIGDAAHTLHPLAGQGVNLGLHDAAELAQTLAARSAAEGYGDYAVLRRYERSRKEAITAMRWVTDSLQRLFGSPLPGVRLLRNVGLDLTNRQTWVKHRLIRQAIG